MSEQNTTDPKETDNFAVFNVKKTSVNQDYPQPGTISTLNCIENACNKLYISPTFYTTLTHTHGIPYDPDLLADPLTLDAQNAEVVLENLRNKFQKLPFFTIDPDGYIPNSEIRNILNKCVGQLKEKRELRKKENKETANHAALELLAKRYCPEDGIQESGEISERLISYLKTRTKKHAAANFANIKLELMRSIVPDTKNATLDLAQLAMEEDDDLFMDDDDRIVRKSDTARLRKLAREVTKKAVMEHMKEKVLKRQAATKFKQDRLNEVSSLLGAFASESDPDDDEDPHEISRETVERLLNHLKSICGTEYETVEVLIGAFNKNKDNLQTLGSAITSSRTRENLLYTLVQPEWCFYILEKHNKSARTLIALLDTLLVKGEENKLAKMAVNKILNDTLGSKGHIKPFLDVFTLCRETMINFFLERNIASREALEEYIREMLCGNEEMKDQVQSLVGMNMLEIEEMLLLVRTCQLEQLEELLRTIPEPQASVKPEESIPIDENHELISTFRGLEIPREDIEKDEQYSKMDSDDFISSHNEYELPGLIGEVSDENPEDQTIARDSETSISETGLGYSKQDSHWISMDAPPIMIKEEIVENKSVKRISLKGQNKQTPRNAARFVGKKGGIGTFVATDAASPLSIPHDIVDQPSENTTDDDVVFSETDSDSEGKPDGETNEIELIMKSSSDSEEIVEELAVPKSHRTREKKAVKKKEIGEDVIDYNDGDDDDAAASDKPENMNEDDADQGVNMIDTSDDETNIVITKAKNDAWKNLMKEKKKYKKKHYELDYLVEGDEKDSKDAPKSADLHGSVVEDPLQRFEQPDQTDFLQDNIPTMTPEMIKLCAMQDEARCMELLKSIASSNNVTATETAIEEVLKFVKNVQGTMDTEALMRIYKALEKIKKHQQSKLKAMQQSSGMAQTILQINNVLERAASDIVGLDGQFSEDNEDNRMTRSAVIRKQLEQIVSTRHSRHIKALYRKTILPQSSSSSSSASVRHVKKTSYSRRQMTTSYNTVSLEEEDDDELTGTMLEAERTQRNRWDEPDQNEDEDDVTFADDEDGNSLDDNADGISSQLRIGKWSEEKSLDFENYLGGGGFKSQRRQTRRSSSDTTIEEVSMGLILPPKLRTVSGENDSKMVMHRNAGAMNKINKFHPLIQDLNRRPETRVLIEKIREKMDRKSLSDNLRPHPLTSREIKDALSDPELVNLVSLLQELSAIETMKSNDPMLERLKNQMDIVSSKVGQVAPIDKLVNLLSLVQAADRRNELDENIDDGEAELKDYERQYLYELQGVVNERLLAEVLVLRHLLPPQRIAWMTCEANAMHQRKCLGIFGQLIQLHGTSTTAESAIVSGLVMNVADGIMAFQKENMIDAHHVKQFYMYVHDCLEALTWYTISIPDSHGILRMFADLDKEIGSILPTTDPRDLPRGNKKSLCLNLAPSYGALLKAKIGRGFKESRIDELYPRISIDEYILKLQKIIAKSEDYFVPVHTPIDVMNKDILDVLDQFEYTENALEMLKCLDMYHTVLPSFQQIYRRVSPITTETFATQLFDRALRERNTKKMDFEALLFTTETKDYILKQIDATNEILPRKPALDAGPSYSLSLKSTHLVPVIYARVKDSEKQIRKPDVHPVNFYCQQSKMQPNTFSQHPQLKMMTSHKSNQVSSIYTAAAARLDPHVKKPCERLSPYYPLSSDDIRHIEKVTEMYKKPTYSNELFSIKTKQYGRWLEGKRRPKPADDSSLNRSESISSAKKKLNSRDAAVLEYLSKHPDRVLEQLRRTLQPGTLTEVIDDIINFPSARHSRSVFAHAMQKAFPDDESTSVIEKLVVVDPHQRIITRPHYVSSNEWQRLANIVNPTVDLPYKYHSKKLHCRYHLLATRSYHKYDNCINECIQRMDIVEHIQKANQQRAHKRIQDSIIQCIEKIIK